MTPKSNQIGMGSAREDDRPEAAESSKPNPSVDLLARVTSGEKGALNDLFLYYQDDLRRIVRARLSSSPLRSECDSMDIVQSSFRAALPTIEHFKPRGPSGLRRWLTKIAVNRIRDAHDRLHASIREIGRKSSLDSESASGPAIGGMAARSGSPREHAESNELRDIVDLEVGRLPADQRRVVVLRDYLGESWDRIALELARENGAVRQLHQRAWAALRARLRPRLPDMERG